ncbi:hypothetical protein C0J45_23460, partial [Silurus meridionalis]
ELIQTRSTVLTPGQSLTLTCKVSGYSLTDSSFCTGWIRQPAGKTLEWIGRICGSGSTYYSEKLKSRFQVTRDTSSSTVTLTGQNMQTEDTAVYYCARDPHSDTHQQHPCTKTSFSGVGGVELTQPASELVKPGESLSISCKTSESSYCIHWIRQPAGKTLEWLGYLCSGGSTYLKDTIKSKISFSQDTSISTVYLRGQNFQPEDTAVYYCARDTALQTSCSAVQKHPCS